MFSISVTIFFDDDLARVRCGVVGLAVNTAEQIGSSSIAVAETSPENGFRENILLVFLASKKNQDAIKVDSKCGSLIFTNRRRCNVAFCPPHEYLEMQFLSVSADGPQ